MKSAIEFHANGKLLIAGEYLVLAGAKALALPVHFGQRMVILETGAGMIEWESSAPGGTWFNASFDPGDLSVVSTGDTRVAHEVKKVLVAARSLNPDFLSGPAGFKVNVTADYPLGWGLGSSSTLISLVAGWAGVDVYELFHVISQGSGYDIACASRSGLLYYRLRNDLPEIKGAKAGKALREYTWFVFLGNKQDSAREVASFLEHPNFSEHDVSEVSRLSAEICDAGSADELIRLVNEHESLLGTILHREPIAGRYKSFPGTVKSLGAWGGDFAMFVSERKPDEVITNLHGLGFSTVFSFNDLEIKS